MDKKGRNQSIKKELLSQKECKDFWLSLLSFINSKEVCGILHKKFEFISPYGKGVFEFYAFDGLYIGISDVLWEKDLIISGVSALETLELSFLIEGEQIISVDTHEKDLVYETQECYLLYLSNNYGTIRYPKNRRFKEIKIRMSPDFIEKHKLHEAYDLQKKYKISSLKEKFSKPIGVKNQEILAEILEDTRQGLLKRLFLESKVLELLSLQLDTKQYQEMDLSYQDTKMVKKLYEVQKIINSDLTEQYSIQQLSRKVGLNDFVVKKEFKRIFGKTVFDYAISQRMMKARKLLLHSQKPIYEISEIVGYKNATHFTAAFKKIEGITPKKYRNSQ